MLEKDFQLIVEPSVPYMQLQNGAAECLGGMIKDKERAMRNGARLLSFLWPEIQRAAVYLHNCIPCYLYNWKIPYD
jgi:hypothetical protein